MQTAGGVNVVIKAGQASMLVQDAFHVPLLELCLGSGAPPHLQLPPADVARRCPRACPQQSQSPLHRAAQC